MASLARKGHPTRAQRRDEMRQRLLGVIERLLAEGVLFNEISMDMLVSEADIARSTFYVYFEDKGDLLRAWFKTINAEISEAATDWWAIDGDSTWDDLRAAQARIFATYRPHIPLMEASNDSAATDPAVRDALEVEMRANAAGLRKHIRAGQKAGFIDANLPPAETADWLSRMAERGLHKLVKDVSDEEFDRLLDAYTHIVWNTLYAPTKR